MGQSWAKNLRDFDQVQLAGWVDIKPGQAEQAAAKLEITGVATGTDYPKMLTELRPDFVVDVTIPEAHHDVTLAALAAGVPVIGEKPMADSMEHARAMVQAAERSGKLYIVSQSRRYNTKLHALRQLIIDHVGPLGILNSDFYIGAHFGGFRDEMPSPLMLDMAIHTLDAARYLCGADPINVYCEEFNPSWSWYKGDACATAIFEMTGGLRYTYRGSWCSDGLHTSWESEWRAVGPNGTATWDGAADPIADRVIEPGGFMPKTERLTREPANAPSGIAGSIRDFLNALKTGATPNGECHDNIKSLAMVFAAMESARAGKRVPVRV